MSMDTTTQEASQSTHTVEQGGFTFTSSEPIGEFVKDLKGGTPAPAEQETPAVEADKETKEAEEEGGGDLSKAAAAIGKKGGEATAAIKRHKEREERKAATAAPAAPAAKAKDAAPATATEEGVEDDPDTAGKKATERVAKEIAAAPLGTKKQLASERVGEATREARAARQELQRERQAREQERQEREQDRRELATLRQQAAAQAKGPQTLAPDAPATQPQRPDPGADPKDVEPQEDDPKYAGNWAPFFQDHTRWTARKEARAIVAQEREAAQHQQKSTQYAQGLVTYVEKFQTRVEEAIAKDPELGARIPNFVKVIERSSYMKPDGEKSTASHVINDAIIDSDHPALLMEYLKTTPAAVQRLLKLPNRDAIAREMVRLEARLELLSEGEGTEDATAGNPSTEPEVSKANPPVRPVTGPPAVA